MAARVLVVSPGVLPLPPVLGGAVENMIARLHPALMDAFEMEYVAVRPTVHRLQSAGAMERARFHYVESINPLADFTADNQSELHESDRWPDYRDTCLRVAVERQPHLIHVHNEAHLLPALRQAAPHAMLVLHINDEVVTRMRPRDLQDLEGSCDLILSCSRHIAQQVEEVFAASGTSAPPIEVFYNFVDVDEYRPSRVASGDLQALRDELGLADDPVLMFVGRMIEQKGPHLLLRTFRRLAVARDTCSWSSSGLPGIAVRTSRPLSQHCEKRLPDWNIGSSSPAMSITRACRRTTHWPTLCAFLLSGMIRRHSWPTRHRPWPGPF